MFIQAEAIRITLHYYRFDGKYDGWNIWAWPYGLHGAGYRFTETGDRGVTARFTVHSMGSSTKVGFIIRRSEPGNDWVEREIGDRFIEHAAGDQTELWIIQGDSNLYYDEQAALARKHPRIASAVMTDIDSIVAVLNKPGDMKVLTPQKLLLKNMHGARPHPSIAGVIPLDCVAGSNQARTFRICMKEFLDITQAYRLELKGWEGAPLSYSGMFDTLLFHQLFTYEGNDLGAAYSPARTVFRLWAPTAVEAEVALYETWDSSTGRYVPMQRSENGTWKADIEENLLGMYYAYRVNVGGDRNEATDPYARALSVNGLRGAIIDLSDTDPPGWEQDRRPPLCHPLDAVIYELHVRDATIHPQSGVCAKGKFLGLAEEGTRSPSGLPTGLDYLSSLGVTHIQLLPIAEFVSVDETYDPPRRYNWGYDPGHYNVPEGSYSTNPYEPGVRIRELKTLIQALHTRGLRIIMDVVYNHMFSVDPSNLGKLVPKYYFRYLQDGRLADGTGVGNDTASERPMMRKLIMDSVIYWAKEYHIDGFRFDLMGIHDVETMNAIRKALDQIDPSIMVYGEGWNLNTPLYEYEKANQRNAARMPRIGQFHDTFRDGVKGSVFGDRQRGFVNGGGIRASEVKAGIAGGIRYSDHFASFAVQPEQTINYVEVHDNHTLWDKLQLSNPDDSLEIRKRMHRLAASILLTSQGIPFLHAGQEWFRTKNGDHNSYRSSDEVNRLDWGRMAEHLSAVAYVRGLIAIRKSIPALRMRTADEIRQRLEFLGSPEGTIFFAVRGSLEYGTNAAMIAVAHNATRRPIDLELPEASHETPWVLLCDGDRAGLHQIAVITERKVTVPALATCIWTAL